MDFTIGIPTYKQNGLLSEAIESALSQTVNCEIIVCADGDDEAYEIASQYPVKVIRQVNKGLASARNSIIMAMTGVFFLPLDSDDILLANAIERILEVIEQTDADIIAPSFKEFGISDREVILMKDPKLEDFKTANRIGYCAAIRRSALLEIGGYSPRMDKGWEDYHLWFNLLSRGKKLITMPEVLWLYRTKKESMYTNSLKYSDILWTQIKKDFPIW